MAIGVIAGLAVATAAGAASAKGTSKAREYLNDGETVQCQCPNCNSSGPHGFERIDRSAAGGAAVGFLIGPLGGVGSGVIAKRVFQCPACGQEMYEEGEEPGWNAGKAMEAAWNYPELKNELEELQRLIAQHKEVAKKHFQEIRRLEREVERGNRDKERLRRRIKTLSQKLRRAA